MEQCGSDVGLVGRAGRDLNRVGGIGKAVSI